MPMDTPARVKWEGFIAGQDVGPMVSPLCDNWALDIPYRWPYDEPEPFPPGHPHHAVAEQMAMAKLCGWDPTFLAGVGFVPGDGAGIPRSTTTHAGGVTRTETRTETPYGFLTSIHEQGKTGRVVKAELETAEDYRRKAWCLRQQTRYDEARVVAEGRMLRQAIGDRGVLGTWMSPPIMSGDREHLFYHLADWPEAVEELRRAALDLILKQLGGLRQAGFDYLFYCVDGTEWISPGFFRRYIAEDTRAIFLRWREMGGFILWHSCGHVARFVEEGFYNAFTPEILETLSEPAVGNLPSLRWARDRLDPAIATKGNIGLDILLNGTQAAVRAAVQRVREQTRGARHIVGLTYDVLAGTPLANARALTEEARRAG